MFLYSKKTDCMVCDFQLVYESDGRLMLDLYAYGQAKEPASIETEAAIDCIDCGLISVSCSDYKKIELKLDTICCDKTLLGKHTEQMCNRISHLIAKCSEVEKRLKRIMECEELNKRSVLAAKSIDILYEGFDALTDVIAYRRLADKISDYLAKVVGIERIATIKVPSYLIIFEEEKRKLGRRLPEKELEKFIWEYGYLEGFSMRETKWEKIDYVRSYAADKEGVTCYIRPLKVQFCPYNGGTWEENVLYKLSWYSECKHIYQLRMLRNIRIYMQLMEMDIIKTDARSLFKDVSAFE